MRSCKVLWVEKVLSHEEVGTSSTSITSSLKEAKFVVQTEECIWNVPRIREGWKDRGAS